MTKIDSIVTDYSYLKGKYDYTLNEINNSFPKDIRYVNKEMLQQYLDLALDGIDIAKKLDMLKYELPK